MPKKLIDTEAWETFYRDPVYSREPYDHYDTGYVDAMDNCDDWIDAQPNINIDTVEVARGTWEPMWDNGYMQYFYRCSKCKEDALTKVETMYDQVLTAYCPHCGAKMKG